MDKQHDWTNWIAFQKDQYGLGVNLVLEVLLDDDMELDDYMVNFRRMYGKP